MASPSRRSKLDNALLTATPQTPHAGLWFDAMLEALPVSAGQGNRAEADSSAFRQHLEALERSGVPQGYQDAFGARKAALQGWTGAIEGASTCLYSATVDGRMAVGLGTQSLVETSLSLHRTWGVPQIPGSALKGLASSTAHRSRDADWRRAETGVPGGKYAQVLFGDTTTAGAVTFHDAWWAPLGETSLPIALDVMTVHHSDYYMKGEVPADWDAPNPVGFVTATGTYLVALTGPPMWVDLAFKWLQLGLSRDGIGAKTHAGYGRMTLMPIAPAQPSPGPPIEPEVLPAVGNHLPIAIGGPALRGQRPAAPPQTEREPRADADGPWQGAEGWMGKDNWNRPILFVRIQRDTLRHSVTAVSFVGDSQTALAAGTVHHPVAIEVLQRRGESLKVRGVAKR